MIEREASQIAPNEDSATERQQGSERIRQAELAAALRFLADTLREAAAFNPATEPDRGRGAARRALVGVIRLIAVLFPNAPALPISLNYLLYALWDLEHGKVVPLLKPATAPYSPGKSLSEELFRALPAAAMTTLMNGRVMKRAEAGKEIARRLTKMGYRQSSGEPFTGAQIGKWRERMMTERPSEDRATANYQLALNTTEPMDPRSAVEFLLQSMPSLYPPNFPKKPPS